MGRGRPTENRVYVIVIGKKLVAAFRNKENANCSLQALKSLLPKNYPINPRIEEVEIQG